MRAIIIGASSGVGKALAEEFAKNGHSLLLVSRDSSDLICIASHLSLIYNVNVEFLAIDANAPEEFSKEIYSRAKNYRDLNWVLFPIGESIEADNGQLEYKAEISILNTNLISIICTTTMLLPLLKNSVAPRIIGFGSIASERGRRSNIIYSCAKRALASYFESIRHLCSDTPVFVQFYKLGYVETQLSFGKKLLFPSIHPKQVAKFVYKNLDNDFGSRYLPWFWRFISFAVISLPWKFFRKLNF